jgi:hypothetical protein
MAEDIPIHTMTSEQAGAELAKMSAALAVPAPTAEAKTPAQAKARLAHLTKDTTWAEKLQSGNPEARREFAMLTELAAKSDPVADAAVAGGTAPESFIDTTIDQELTTKNVLSAIDVLTELGIQPAGVQEIFSDKKYSGEEYRAAEGYLRSMQRDPDLAKRFLAGEATPRELRLWTAACGVVSKGVEGA